MTPLELSILMQYYVSPEDPENITNSSYQEICDKYCDDGILTPLSEFTCVEPVSRVGPHFKITEKGKVYFGGIMAAVSSVPLPIYVIPDGERSHEDTPNAAYDGLTPRQWRSGTVHGLTLRSTGIVLTPKNELRREDKAPGFYKDEIDTWEKGEEATLKKGDNT